MDLENFSDLSLFIYSEYEKMSDAFGLQHLPEKSIKFAEKSIRKYTKLYDKPLYEKEKRELQLKIALDTMPHSWLWKLFHSKLWARMKLVLSQNENSETTQVVEESKQSEKTDILVPAVIFPKEYDVLEEETLQQDFSTDFD